MSSRRISPQLILIVFALALPSVITAQSTAYDNLLARAKSELTAGQTDQALSDSKKAIALKADRWDAHMIAGYVLQSEKRYDEAVEEFSHALEYAPADKKADAKKFLEECMNEKSAGSTAQANSIQPANSSVPGCRMSETAPVGPSAQSTGVGDNSTTPGTFQNKRRASEPPPTVVAQEIQASKLLSRTPPVYPSLAQATRIEGTVALHVIIEPDGSVDEIKVVSGHPFLVQAAVNAVKAWRYVPTLVNGKPVSVDSTIAVIFSLGNPPSAVSVVPSPGRSPAPPPAVTQFSDLKLHFTAGQTALQNQKYDEAIVEFQNALDAASANDKNRALVLANLGTAYENTGRYADAVNVFRDAIAITPLGAYYSNLGSALLKMAQADEASVAFRQAIIVDPPGAAAYWSNLGIGLINSGKLKEAIDPLRNATQADPNNPKNWYLLGTALASTVEIRETGSTSSLTFPPGTAEAFQRVVSLDANGYGQQANRMLDGLRTFGVRWTCF